MLLNDKVTFRMQWPQYADLQVNGMLFYKIASFWRLIKIVILLNSFSNCKNILHGCLYFDLYVEMDVYTVPNQVLSIDPREKSEYRTLFHGFLLAYAVDG